MPSFVAIDFETADNGRDSACSVALVMVRGGAVVDSVHHLIRPPRSRFLFTHIHGIRWRDVADSPDFGELWPAIAGAIAEAPFLVAHNAPFDRGVLEGCCAAHGIPAPRKNYVCTVQVAREMWNLPKNRLPDVCGHLGLALNHHDALSDATACAEILLAAVRQGYDLGRRVRA
ncbi:MAG TPA: 3'-5' exonuclease [Candidatus Omnitrophota bacterium]|nr:3'-5' exonuclease [Candidatus Omnitrophota bacterium]